MSPRTSLGRPAALVLGLSAGLALGLAACADDSEPPDGPTVISGVSRIDVPLGANREIDVLFVIDSSPGIAPQRAKLLASYRRFMEIIETQTGEPPDLHIGVVTADLGTRGPADAGPGPSIGTGPGSCTSDGDRGELRRGAAVSGSFISDIGRADGTRERNYSGSLADAFVQLADVGTSGCAYPRPLEAARRALDGNPANAGFLRKHAFLTVVLVTNADDCSFGSSSFTGGQLDPARCATDGLALVGVEQYVAFLRSLKQDDPSKVLMLGAFEPAGAPTCTGASPAPRLSRLMEDFPYRSDVASICDADLGRLGYQLAPVIKYLLVAPCFEPTPLDLDPAAPGLQPECDAWYSYVLDGEHVEERIPACGPEPTSAACWQIKPDDVNCFPGAALFDLRNQRRFGIDSEAHMLAECVIR